MAEGTGDRPARGPVADVGRHFLADPRHGPLPALLLVLTVVTGVVDAVSILRMNEVFVANMTGNVVFVGFGLAGARGFSVAASCTALAGFVVGAFAGRRFPASWRPDRPRLLWSASLVKLTLGLPVVVVVVVQGIHPDRPAFYPLIVLLAASMGVQNASVHQLGVPDLTTNVVTSAIRGLFTELPMLGWRHRSTAYRLGSVLSLFAGGAVGATLVLDVGSGAALILGAVLLAVVGVTARVAGASGAGWTAFSSPSTAG